MTASQDRVARPHVVFCAIGFPPAAKSSAYRLREIANRIVEHGWDVTVVTIDDESWVREYGLDHTLSDDVDPRIRIHHAPLARVDLETDLWAYDRERAVDPIAWNRELRLRDLETFPEPMYGGWLDGLTDAVRAVHADHPADLLLISCGPYVWLGVLEALREELGVPYAVDYRDGWSVDVLNGGEAFAPDSREGRIEAAALSDAQRLWFVNDPIADFYRERYPHLADRVRVVRNGFDPASIPVEHRAAVGDAPLTFGYLGSANFGVQFLADVLDGWRLARDRDPQLARSCFEVHGHFGAGSTRSSTRHMELLRAAASDGVSFHGPLPKAEVGPTLARWDALVLMLVGGRYVTSGKVYEFMAAGLPIVSAHAVEHDASRLLDGHPLWTGARGTEPERLAEAFVDAARLARETGPSERDAGRRHAEQYSRDRQLVPQVVELLDLVDPRGDTRE